MNRSKTTKVKEIVRNFDARIRHVFNREFFSIYEGIVEVIDEENAIVTVRVPELNNSVFKECRVLTPCSTENSVFLPNFEVNSSVIVGFKSFSLKYPIILGQISAVDSINAPLENGTIKIKNGSSELTITADGVTIKNGNSTISVTATGVEIDGDSVTAGGEDLLSDDVGAM